MRIGIIGAGNIGMTLARLWVAAGHEVVLSYSRDRELLDRRASALGPSASTGLPAEAAACEVVVISVPWPRLGDAVAAAGDLSGRLVVDTCNPFASPGGAVDLPPGAVSAAAVLAGLVPGARLVKAFNTLYYETLAKRSGRDGGRLAVPLSGDLPQDVDVVAGLVRDAGYEPVVIGGLGGAARQEPGGPLYDAELTVDQVRDRLRALEQENLALARRFLTDVLGAGDARALEVLVDDDVVVHSGLDPLEPMRGRAAFAQGLESLGAFTFTDFGVEDLLAVEDRVIARYRAHADHTGDRLGVPATGLNITMWEIRLMRWRGGRLVEDFVADINYDWPWLVAPAYPDGVGRTGRS